MTHSLFSLLPFFLFFLFDNYIPGIGIRPFDFVGLVLLVFLAILRTHRSGLKLKVPAGSLWFAGGLLLYLLISLMFRSEQINAHIGIIFGLFVFIYFRSLAGLESAYNRGLERVLQLSVAALFFQFAYYLIAGDVFDFVLFSDGGSRVWYGGSILRPSGLFVEPNSYCLATAMIVLLRRQIMAEPFDRLSYLAIVSMFMSMSLWGGLTGILLMVYDLFGRGCRVALLSFVSLPVFIIFGYLFAKSLDEENPFLVTMLDRGTDLVMSMVMPSSSDVEGSYGDRYESLRRLFDSDNLDHRTFFGYGVSTSNFQEYGGANGISFLIYSFGIFGVTLFAFVIILCAKGRFGPAFAVFISLSSYPLATYFFWWAWLGLLFTASGATIRKTNAEDLFENWRNSGMAQAHIRGM